VSDPTQKDPVPEIPLRARPRPVTRLNRRTLVIGASLAALVVLIATLWAFTPHPVEHAKDADSAALPPVPKAEGLSKLPKDYTAWQVPGTHAPELGPSTGELGRPVLRAEAENGIPRELDFKPDPDEDHARVTRLREQEEAESAAKAKIFFPLNREARAPVTDAASPAPGLIPETSPSLAPISAPAGGTSTETSGGQLQKERFINQAADPKTEASGSLKVPRSPYELLAGTVIAAALLTGIDSDLPGEVIASVTQSVYDTVTGQHLLIPQGSRLIGEYDSQVAFGQRRVLLVWTRLIRPDGSSIVLDRLPGMDTEGHAGLEDQVDYHWGRLFAGAAISTLLGINAELVAQNQSNGSVIVATRDSAQDSVNQSGQQLTRKNLDVQPTLKVRPGFELRVMVKKDLTLFPFATAK
jgi:type IV secretory pathway VirB10-like protein